MTYNIFAAGVNTSFSSELNENFSDLRMCSSPIVAIYAGSAYDTTISGINTATSSHTIDIPAADLANLDYLEVTMSYGYSASKDTDSSQHYVKLKLESSPTGGAYATEFDKFLHNYSGTLALAVNTTATYVHVVAVTAGMRTDGCTLRFSSTSSGADSGSAASFANNQTVIRGQQSD